jgi:ribosome-associated translation inhibitor RaiA
MKTAIRELSDDIKRQVKRHRELRRKRSQTRRKVGKLRGGGTAIGG